MCQKDKNSNKKWIRNVFLLLQALIRMQLTPRQITWSALLLRMPFRLFFSPFAHFRRRRENYALLL